MSYGIEVLNRSGRTIFVTTEAYPNYYSPSSPISINGYGAQVDFTPGSSNILLARPQDGESGAVYVETFFTPNKVTFGSSVSFGACDGIKYVQFSRQDLLSRATAGYGIEVYKENGQLLYTSNTSFSFNILSSSILTGTQTQTFTCPPGVNFNNVYVTALSCAGAIVDVVGGGVVPSFSSFQGALAHFNASTGVITIKHGAVTGDYQSISWNSNFNKFYSSLNRRDYLIVEVKS